ncbi:hypothetical protein J3F82_004908 [Coemansia sp. RSA 637]|nr:hypothetical protein J3F82_004908 [Coemansia sp. RSA 637]
MGIPGVWRWLQQLCPTACKTASRVDQPNTHSLFVDLNSTIHTSARQSNGNMASVLLAIDRVVKQVQPQHLLFLAIDGVPPRLKERLQRQRRSRPEPYMTDSADSFSAYFVTPGTLWMRQLETKLTEYIKEKRRTDREWAGLRVVLSGSRDPGEGEQKIMAYVRRLPRHSWDHHVVWSNDADSVLLALATHTPNITVVSERWIGTTSSYTVVDVDTLRTHIVERYTNVEARSWMSKSRIVDDLVFMTFLVGNDFLPPLLNGQLANDGLVVDGVWAMYPEFIAKHKDHLHRNGRISPLALQTLLRVLVREREERQFRRYVGVTQLGPQLTAMRVRRMEWDIQRQKLEDSSGSDSTKVCKEELDLNAWDLSEPAHRKKAKHKGKSSVRISARTNCGRRIPYVWTGKSSDFEQNVKYAAQMSGAAPLTNVFPVYTPQSKRTDGLMLKLDNVPLISIEMYLIFDWIQRVAAEESKPAIAGVLSSINHNKVAWLRSFAKALGMKLEAYGMGDTEYKPMYKKWKHAKTAMLCIGQATSTRPSLVLTLNRLASSQPLTNEFSTISNVSVVGDNEWDTLLADAHTEYERDLKISEWKASFYAQRSTEHTADRITTLYARALGWTAHYFFTGTVSSWEFTWPDDIDIAPLPSDLLACVSSMGTEWSALPESDKLPPLLREHLLSVLPPEAWSSLGQEEQTLARLLSDSEYSEETRMQVHAKLANTTEEAPMVDIWL